ncbi:hypothetical protein ACYSNX_01175 [Myroides sp. LJL115]
MYELQKKYNQLSKGFRASQYKDNNLLADLFTLKEKLEQKELLIAEKEILVGLYTLLEFHQKAYQLYDEIADTSLFKQVARLSVLQDKALSMKDTFARKDPREPIVFHAPTTLELSGFIESDKAYAYHLRNKEVVVFQKKVSCDRVYLYKEDEVELNALDIKMINKALSKMANFKEELILFYNKSFETSLGLNANAHWYTTLEVFSLHFNLYSQDDMEVRITAGDNNLVDHLLDICVDNLEVVSMDYDG